MDLKELIIKYVHECIEYSVGIGATIIAAHTFFTYWIIDKTVIGLIASAFMGILCIFLIKYLTETFRKIKQSLTEIERDTIKSPDLKEAIDIIEDVCFQYADVEEQKDYYELYSGGLSTLERCFSFLIKHKQAEGNSLVIIIKKKGDKK